MQKIFGSLAAQFSEFMRGLSPTKRLSMLGALVVGLVAVAIVGYMVSGRDYAPLLTNVPSDQVSTVVQQLNSKNIPFQLRDGGKTIAVPKELLHSTQMTLMAEVGSSRIGQIGLELFDKQEFTTNSYTQKVNYQRALQGELMRTVNTLSAVKQSKVLLALPNKKTFLEESTPPTASVVVELYPGKVLSPEQVRGIRYLVSSAVEGLDADRVTVVDDRGKILTRMGDQASGAASELMELKEKIESKFENDISLMLTKAVGQGKVVAKVDATLNNRVIAAVEEAVDPEKTAVRSVTSEEESLDGSRVNPSGVPGARANLPGAENANQVGFNQNVRKELKTTNYEVPKVIRNIKEAAGGIERLSVAVMIDGSEQTVTKDDGTTETKWVPRTPEELQKFEALVKSTIGFNAARGDSVKIENIPFAKEDFSEAERLLTNLERKKLIQSVLKWLLLGFSLALFIFVVLRPFMQWVTESFQDSVEEMLPRTIEELEELQAVDNTLPGMSSALPVLEESIDPDKAESELLKDRIMGIVSRDEEKATSALTLWLSKRDERP